MADWLDSLVKEHGSEYINNLENSCHPDADCSPYNVCDPDYGKDCMPDSTGPEECSPDYET